jgi:heptosyltransferase-2
MIQEAAPPRRHGKRILVRGVNWLGDAVMSTPALARLREAYPDASIALLTPEKLADLWQYHPAIDTVIKVAPNERLSSLKRRLRQGNFQVGLVLPNSFRSALELWLGGIPERFGYAGQMRTWLLTHPIAARPGAVRMHKRTPQEVRTLTQGSSASPPDAANTRCRKPADVPDTAHHIHQYLYLVGKLGANPAPLAPHLVVREEEVEAVRERFQIERIPERPLFGLNPGAEYGPAKRWPVASFIEAASEIQRRTGCQWVVFGGRGDLELARQVTDGIENAARRGRPTGARKPVLNLAAVTTLRELCAVMKICQVVLTNDTGPMHLAAAVGAPVVVPFGSTSPFLTGPGLPGDTRHAVLRSGVPCAPCFLRECPIDFRCMRNITVAQVVEEIDRVSRRSGAQ